MDLQTAKKFLIIAAVGILLILIFMITIFYPKGDKKISLAPTATPVIKRDIYPPVSLPDSLEDKITISDIKMNNFYRNPVKINRVGDVTFVSKDWFNISYLAIFKQFIISVRGSPFEDNRKSAETELLAVLGIEEQQACKLNVTITVPFFADPQKSGEDYPLSFCR